MGRLVLAGAGHAHMAVMAHLPEIIAKGHTVIGIGPGPRHYYSGMGPGMLGGDYRPEDISFPVKEMIEDRGGEYVQGKVARIDPEKRIVTTEAGGEIPYDVLSCNLGSYVPSQVLHDQGAQDVFTVKPIENLLAARQRILDLAAQRTVRVGVCGGGAAALEVAGNAYAAGREQGRHGCKVQVFAGSGFLKRMPEKVQRLAKKSMKNRGIEIFAGDQGNYVKEVRTGSVTLQNGQSYEQDIIFMALGVHPSNVFADSGLPTGKDGGLRVNRFLQCVDHPEIFGGGDCIWYDPQPLDKVGVYAVRENPILLHNLQAQLEGNELQPFEPGGSYLLIFNVGERKGVLHKSGIAFDGKLAFFLKDWIDRKFIREFQPQ